ncbi:DMT family transporter [Shewanella sp. c952]|uniref:DMT family transporter n=1 Tax=Shewanella sp. c952 TaxID=2815913 RepID=UPI001C7DC776|nr:EamA family transporter [Shewanella sp. c952]
MNSQQSLGFMLLAVLSAVLMATIGVFARYTALPAEHITFYRLVIGAACMLVFMLISGKAKQVRHKPSKRTVINGIMLAGFMVFYVQAISYINMANAVMLIYLAPLTTAAFAHFVYKERLNSANCVLIIFALIGFGLMLPSSLNSQNQQQALGYLYATLAMLSYSGFMLINRKPSQSTPYQSTLVQLSVGAVCLLPFVLQVPIMPSAVQWSWLVAIGILPGFLAILFAVKALRALPAISFGTLAYFEPVAVVIFAWSLFGESLNVIQLTGASMIILAGITQGIVMQKLQQNKLIKSEQNTPV